MGNTLCSLTDLCKDGKELRDPCSITCQHPTCQDQSTAMTCVISTDHCKEECLCPVGMYENSMGVCVKIEECECEDSFGKTYPPGYVNIDELKCVKW